MPYPKYFIWLYDRSNEVYYRTRKRYQSLEKARKGVSGITNYEIRDAVNHVVAFHYPKFFLK